MQPYQRIFGAGPTGLLISLALLALTWWLAEAVGGPTITDSDAARWTVFAMSVLGTVILLAWSARSLPPGDRGRKLVTSGAYGIVRHPVYAAFLSCFNFGLAVLLNNWLYVAWAVVQHGVWHCNVRREEALMLRRFPHEYAQYCRGVGRFVPRVRSLLGDRFLPTR